MTITAVLADDSEPGTSPTQTALGWRPESRKSMQGLPLSAGVKT